MDLAVFVPDGELMAKCVRMRAARLMPDGTIQTTEIHGPPDVKTWRRAFDMFRTCCLMWDVITAETLDMYAEAIELLVDRYGANLWSLIYQFDVKTRQTHVHRVRRRLAEEKRKALANNWTHDYNPLQPWEEVFVQIVQHEETWWRDEAREPLGFIKNGARPSRSTSLV